MHPSIPSSPSSRYNFLKIKGFIFYFVLARRMQLPSHNDFKKGIVRELTGKINKEKPK